MVDMNRREFLKRAAGAVVAIPVMAVLVKLEDATPEEVQESAGTWMVDDVDTATSWLTATDYASMEKRYMLGHQCPRVEYRRICDATWRSPCESCSV